MIRLAFFVSGVLAPIGLLAIPYNEHGPRFLREPSHFTGFLEKCLNTTVLDYTIKPLTKYGENFGAVLQSLEVKLSNTNDSNETDTLQLVIKAMLPGSVPVYRSKQFWKEKHFYSDIMPALHQFEKAVNIPVAERIDDAFARYFCSRFSLEPEAVNADTDALIILENLKSVNFVSSNRWDRMDSDEIFAGSKRLAKLHALFIAMRRLQPNLFYSKVDPYLEKTLTDSFEVAFVDKITDRVEKFIEKVPSDFSSILPQLRNVIENAKNTYKDYIINANRVPETPYTTLYHGDLHTKNIMTKRSGNENTSIQMKILDFQFYYYKSFALDLIQFLFFNGRIDDLRADFKTFINYYISEFVKMLRLSNCPLDDYTNDKMWNEIKDKATINLLQIYYFLDFEKSILLQNDMRLAASGEDFADFYYNYSTPTPILKRWKCVTDLFIENGFI